MLQVAVYTKKSLYFSVSQIYINPEKKHEKKVIFCDVISETKRSESSAYKIS